MARHPTGNRDLLRQHIEHQREGDRELGQTTGAPVTQVSDRGTENAEPGHARQQRRAELGRTRRNARSVQRQGKT